MCDTHCADSLAGKVLKTLGEQHGLVQLYLAGEQAEVTPGVTSGQGTTLSLGAGRKEGSDSAPQGSACPQGILNNSLWKANASF